MSEPATRYALPPNMITNWKWQAIENMVETFSSKAERAAASATEALGRG